MNLHQHWQAYKLREELRRLLAEDSGMRFPTGQTTSIAVERLLEIGKRVWEIRLEIRKLEGK